MRKKSQTFMGSAVRRTAMLLIALLALPMGMWAQEKNEKFAWTTQMFLNEQKKPAEQPASSRRHAPSRQTDDRTRPAQRQLIASPDTIGGKAYISCFIHLRDVSNLSDVQALGVEVEETFDGLDFVTALVPVNQIEALADIDNVTNIKVAQLMRPMTDKAREQTYVDDLLPNPAAGINTNKYDGTGVVLGIIDTGIDFQHIAFKDKDGNSRIKRAYVYAGGESATVYKEETIGTATTDDATEDHGTHTSSIAGGSSVIVGEGGTVTVTDEHANATYGGMAPGADLYLAGVKGLKETHLAAALNKMVQYADSVKKPLVVSNSWGAAWGPRNGTSQLATLVGTHFGDSHPNHIILFASGNDGGHCPTNMVGGYFVKKNDVSSSSPLGTVIRSSDGGDYYDGFYVYATSTVDLACTLYILNSSTGAVLATYPISENLGISFSDHYDGTLTVITGKSLTLRATGFESKSENADAYTLAIEVYPASESETADVNIWTSDDGYFTGNLNNNWTDTGSHTWTAGTDDMCVCDEATIPDAISVGAYVSKKSWKNYENNPRSMNDRYIEGDIAYFSSYATAACSPTGLAYPYITAPGSMVAAGVNHLHTQGNGSYYSDNMKNRLVVNSDTNPYGMMQGTSMATPVAAGIVALWLQAAEENNKSLTVNDVKNIMQKTAIHDSYTAGTNGTHFGNGKINALAGIRYIQGTTLAISNVTATTAKATWTACDGVTEYTIQLASDNQFTTGGSGGSVLEADFSEIFGWTFSGTGTYSSSPYVGAGSPSIKFDDNGDYAISPDFGSGTKLQFWAYGNGGSGSTFAISGLVNGSWTEIETVTIAKGGDTYEVTLPTGTSQVRFDFTKNVNCALDDVVVTGAPGAGSLIAEYTVTDGTSYTFTGLTPETTYYARVKGNAGWSSVKEFTTVTATPVDISLANATDNSSVLETNNGRFANVTLSGRTLFKDGEWNTLCLPFDVAISGGVLDGADVRALSATDFDNNNGTLTLTFTGAGDVTEIKAGKPYIIRWGTPDNHPNTNIVNPVFSGVTVKSGTTNTQTDYVTFIGTFSPTTLTGGNKSVLYLGTGNKLFYPAISRTINACRAYFQLNGITAGDITNGVKMFFGEDDADGIGSLTPALSEGEGAIYNVAGQRLQKLQRGINIVNGKKIIILK